jgi:hypothetical protein
MKNEKEHKPDFHLPGIDSKKLRENPFKTPKGYFENLTPRMLQAVSETPVKEKVGILQSFLRPQFLAPAFSIAVIAVYLTHGNALDLDQQFGEMAIDLQYEQLATIEGVDLIDLVESDLINLEFASITYDDDITDYLLENDVELSTLLDEITL